MACKFDVMQSTNIFFYIRCVVETTRVHWLILDSFYTLIIYIKYKEEWKKVCNEILLDITKKINWKLNFSSKYN